MDASVRIVSPWQPSIGSAECAKTAPRTGGWDAIANTKPAHVSSHGRGGVSYLGARVVSPSPCSAPDPTNL